MLVSDSGYCRAHRTKSHGDICLVMAVVHNHKMNSFEWALVLTLSVLWGGSFFFVDVTARELPTFAVLVSRVACWSPGLRLQRSYCSLLCALAAVRCQLTREYGGLPGDGIFEQHRAVFVHRLGASAYCVWRGLHFERDDAVIFRVSGSFLCQ